MAASLGEMTERARAFLLASMAIGYPDRDLAEELAAVPVVPEGVAPLVRAIERSVEDVQGAYIERFERGKERVSLYETEYGRMRGLSKGNELADLCGFYQAFGMTLEDRDVHELADHVGVELEFYGILLIEQAVQDERGNEEGRWVVERARVAFLTDHLGRFVRAIAERPAVVGDPIYGPLLAWCAELVAAECEELCVRPAPLDFFEVDGERDSTECGAVRLPVLPS